MAIEGAEQKIRVFLNDGRQVLGTVFIKGYRTRLSNLINNSQPFLNITNVKVSGHDGIVSYPFLCLNKQTIHSVVEESTARSPQARMMASRQAIAKMREVDGGIRNGKHL